MKRTLLSYLGLFSIAGFIVALDQWTKWLVRTNLPYTGTWLPQGMEWLAPYARIVHWNNSGAAFGMFQNGSLVFGILAFIVILVIAYYYPRTDPADWTLRLAMAMQLAGAAGNLIDRLLFNGEVTDFISVGNFPVWNVADASIVVGVGVLLLGVWWHERHSSDQSTVNNDPLGGPESNVSDFPGVGRQGSSESEPAVESEATNSSTA